MINYLVFNGVNLKEQFRLRVSGDGSYGSSDLDYETIQVPGRDGDIRIKNGRANQLTLKYSAFIYKDFENNFNALRDFLMQDGEYHRLEDTYHRSYYMQAAFTGSLDPDVTMRSVARVGKFDLEFSAIPRRYLKSGEHRLSITASTVLMNPTYNVAKPMIYVTGTGSFTIGNVGMAVTKNNGALVIDCETQECYEGQENRNGDVTISSTDTEYDFPVLKSGRNTITVSGVTLEIEPRWFVR
jgi:phage-related protein